MFDIIIIGGGVIGALTARELSKFSLKTVIVEKASDVGMGATSANSGIVHAGHDADSGTLKAKYNVEGNRLMYDTAKELGVKCGNIGSLVVAFDDNDLKTLTELKSRGEHNGVEKLTIIDRQTLQKLEPNIGKNVVGALEAKTGGIICPYELCIAACGNAMDNGVELITDFEVVGITCSKSGFSVQSKDSVLDGKVVINCGGINADKIAAFIGDKSFKIGARRGEYILLDRECQGFVTHTLFSCPNKLGKGVLVTPTVDNNILIGPTSFESEDREDNSISSTGLDYIHAHADRLCDNIPYYNTITSFTGLRAYSDRHDFIIENSKVDPRFINVAGIESPGLTASPAIARAVASMAVGELDNVVKNENFVGTREADYFFKLLSVEERNRLIAKDGDYGKIVCRCEEITLGEIKHALSRNPIPTTVDAIKRRTRAGMGRCQGGFCMPSVTEIIREHFDIPLAKVTKKGGSSYIFTDKTK